MRTFLILLLLALVNPVQSQNFTSYFTGTFTDTVTSPLGGVCMMGGATENDEAMKWFLERANGGNILILRASGSDGYNDYLYSELGIEVNSVESIVCLNEESTDESYIHDRISKAEGIWFAGGDQWNYINYWRNTIIEDLLHEAINDRNIVIGGTSAGMAILGEYYFAAEFGTVTSQTALNNPISLSTHIDSIGFLEIDYLENVITDTHYDDPDRRGRHVAFLANIYSQYGVYGRGIACEEYTSVCIDEAGMARVYGGYPDNEDYALFIQPNCELTDFSPEILEEDTPLTWNRSNKALKVYKVPGTNEGTHSFDLTNWQVGSGGAWENWYVEAGEFVSETGNPIDCSISIQENISEEWTVYPNPFEEFVTIEARDAKLVSFEIYDLSGKRVCNIPNANGQAFIKLDLNFLDSGVYILHIRSESKIENFTLYKE